jgi:hypothetical protein
MSRWIAGVIVVASMGFTVSAYAQETAGPGKLEVAIIPAGATFFTSEGPNEPSFGSYDVGGSLVYNFTQVIGVEGEVGGSLGIKQDLTQFGGTINEKTPNMLSYQGNVVFNMTRQALVPYATVGVGGLSMYHRDTLGVDNDETFLTANVGGGLKWYRNDRWGLRGDYRFQAVRSKSSAPEFFGQNNRYGHRVYAAVVINAVR